MSDIAFSLDFTGTPNRDDEDAALLVIQEANDVLIAQDPPGTPWPSSDATEIKASYLAIMADKITQMHSASSNTAAMRSLDQNNIKQLWVDATDAQRAAAISAIQA